MVCPSHTLQDPFGGACAFLKSIRREYFKIFIARHFSLQIQVLQGRNYRVVIVVGGRGNRSDMWQKGRGEDIIILNFSGLEVKEIYGSH